MKFSKYVKIINSRISKNHAYLYNGISGALIKLDENFRAMIETALCSDTAFKDFTRDKKNTSAIENLKKGRYIIPKDLDELSILKMRYNVSRFNDAPHITIVPTMDCNLNCAYCFEKNHTTYMDGKTIEQIKTFYDSWIQNHKSKKIQIDWYGGEPLMAIDTMVGLSSHFIKSTESIGGVYGAAIVTNGTLLDKDVFDKLIQCNISKCQITIDGDKNIHDKRRGFIDNNKRSSYDKIMENISNIIGKIPIYLRINVDNHNYSQVFELLEIFDELGWMKENMKFNPYLAPISAYNEHCSSIDKDCMGVSSFIDLSIDFFKRLEKYKTVKKNLFYLYPQTKKYNCGAVGLNSFLIGPTGSIFKCGVTVDDNKNAVGSVFNKYNDLIFNNIGLKWGNFDPFSTSKCKKCDILPTCLGGCPFMSISKNSAMIKRNCDFQKDNFEKMILYHAGEI